jgi:hypothetical protein
MVLKFSQQRKHSQITEKYIQLTFNSKILTIKYVICFRQQAIFQANSESYNGAIRDKSSWSQSIQDLDVHIKVCFNVYI